MKHRGFTLIELLLVVAIIGLLTTLATAVFGSSRMKTRDAKRASNIKAIQTALELSFAETSSYPATNDTDGLGPDSSAILGSATASVLCKVGGTAAWVSSTAGCAGGTVYMTGVPSNPTPPNGGVFRYAGSAGAYQILFSLENGSGSLQAGANCANQNGIQPGTAC